MATSKRDPITIHSERLTLRLADPDSDDDCHHVLRCYNDTLASKGGNGRLGINTVEDVRLKNSREGVLPHLCSRAAPPYGSIFLIILPPQLSDSSSAAEARSDDGVRLPEGRLIGNITLSFRQRNLYPDLGYGLISGNEGRGYASEAGRRVLSFWHEEIGVRDIFCGALEGNVKSLRCAERIGFVRCGFFDVEFGHGDDVTTTRAVAFVLPGMQWRDYDDQGNVTTIRPTVGTETEEQKKAAITFST